MDWKPIISSGQSIARDAWRSISAIAEDLLKHSYPPTRILPPGSDLSYYAYEEALLFAYMARCTGDLKWGHRCLEQLNQAIERSNGKIPSFSLFGGLCGLGWAVEHVSKVLCEVFEHECEHDCIVACTTGPDEDPNFQVDDAVVQCLVLPLQSGPFDLINGLVGYGLYFLERWPRGRSVEGLELVVNALERIAEDQGPTTTWFSTPVTIPRTDREQCPAGYYNLGVAHGVPGVVQFLYQVVMSGIRTPKVVSLLDRSIAWLLAHATVNDGTGLRFHAWLTPDGGSRPARPRWCYGDLGIGAVLFQIGKGMGRPYLRNLALDMFEKCLALPTEAYAAGDAGLCHGATGIAHIYNRIYQLEGDSRFRDAALNWYERALAMYRPSTGVGGYSKRYSKHGKIRWEPWPRFLDGSIGVALALLAATTSKEPEWDRALLLSSRFSQPRAATYVEHQKLV